MSGRRGVFLKTWWSGYLGEVRPFHDNYIYWYNQDCIFSGSADFIAPTPSPTGSPTCTPTLTPTLTPTNTPIVPSCLDQITVSASFSPINTEWNGTYTRVSSYTGGTFNYGWVDNVPTFHTGTSPDGNNYLVYVRNVGSTAYTITNYYFTPSSLTRYYSIFKTIGSLVDNQVTTNFGAQIGFTGTTQGTTYVLTPGTQRAYGTDFTFTYPVPCPTPSPTASPTNTNTPSQTP